MLGLLQNGTVDTFADGEWFATEKRVDYFRLSFPLIAVQNFHMVRRPDIGSFQGISLIFAVFSTSFYLAIASIVVGALLLDRISLKGSGGSRIFEWVGRTFRTIGSSPCGLQF